MEKFLELNSAIIAIFGVGMVGLLTGILTKFSKFLDDRRAEDKLHRDAMLAILHNKVYKNGVEYIKKGKVTVGQLNDIEKLYAPYKAMGGNSTADLIISKVRDLPLDNASDDDVFLKEVKKID